MKNIFFLSIATLFMLSSCSQEPKPEMVLIETSFGNMKAVLYDETPKHRDNFVKLVNEGYYDSLLFHRVMETFMIQGGDPDSRNAADGTPLGMGGPDYTIPAEILPQFTHVKGALAAARTNNPQKESSGSQFYIVDGKPNNANIIKELGSRNNVAYSEEQLAEYATTDGAPFLDGQYTVFGQVVEGLDVIDKIAAVQVDRMNRPLENVYMKITLIK